MKRAIVAVARSSAPRSAASTNAPPLGRSRRTRRRRRCSESSAAAHRRYSAGGCSGSAGRRRFSTIARTPRAPCRACSRGVSAQPFERRSAQRRGMEPYRIARLARTNRRGGAAVARNAPKEETSGNDACAVKRRPADSAIDPIFGSASGNSPTECPGP
jgi:hypothetical protein